MSATSMATSAAKTHARFLIVFILFLATNVNYADRATLSIAGSAMSKELHIDPIAMGYIFSAFGWSYVVAQIPGGWLLDRFGSKWVYAVCILIWSLFTVMQGWIGFFSAGTAVVVLFGLRLMVGVAEAPSFPGNERGTASAVFNSGQYFATVMFAPLMGWIATVYGWPYVFFVMGGLGVAMGLIWIVTIYAPRQHPMINDAEFEYIKAGGALVEMDAPKATAAAPRASNGSVLKQLLSNRMLAGVYLGQYCINTLTTFFLTWFPVYLVNERHLTILKAGFVAMLPALCGFLGGILGGIISDFILRRSGSLTLARKVPIVGGMLLSMVIVGCNYVDDASFVVGFMALAFFGKGIGALGWAVISDTAPKEAGGLTGGLFNMFGNISTITTPIAIGYILAWTGSFNGALVFVGVNALVAAFAYLVVVGKIERFQLKPA